MIQSVFMHDFDAFDAERKCVATLEDVKAFQDKWFPKGGWPDGRSRTNGSKYPATRGGIEIWRKQLQRGTGQ